MKEVKLLFAALAMTLLPACGDGEVASINGREITQEQFSAYLEFKRLPSDNSDKKTALMDQYVEREALAQAVIDSDLLNKRLIDAELNEFRKEMVISRYFEIFLANEVTDQAVQNYYVANEKSYEERNVHVAHILFRTRGDMSETERKAKLTAAQDAHGKLLAGSDFAKIAAKYSEDQGSGKKGGDLGLLKEGAIDPRFSDVIFSLKKGAISEPFETAFGFHIVKILEEPTVVKRSLETVKGDIRYQLRNKARDEELKRLKSQVTVRKHYE